MPMNNRKNDRHQVLKAGTISFQGSTIDCAVHDLSLGGAKLEVDSHVGIPDTFDLLIADTGKQRCHVVWRKETRIGVAFS
jgi:PilZ domain